MVWRRIVSGAIVVGLMALICACEPEKKESAPQEKGGEAAMPACPTVPKAEAQPTTAAKPAQNPRETCTVPIPAPSQAEKKPAVAAKAPEAKPEAKAPAAEPARTPTWDLEGEIAPEIHAATWLNTAKPLSLQEFRKKKFVLLNFWFTKCPHCHKETPRIQEFYSRFNGPLFQVITIVSDLKDNRENVEKYIKDNGVAFPVAIDDNAKTFTEYAMHTVPFVYIINRYGYVIWQGHPHYLEAQKISEMLRDAGEVE